jgi:hypothetical protein
MKKPGIEKKLETKENRTFRECRQAVVGWNTNAPDPFPGFTGTVGLGQDFGVLANGDWLLVFHAGYWHVSMATPFIVPRDRLVAWEREGGMPANIEAPEGGRTLAVRSSDRGRTWSRPRTVTNGPWDRSPVGMTVLGSGRILLFINEQASWYGLNQAPEGHLPMNTRIGVMHSDDHGQTWNGPEWLENPYPYYQRTYARFLELPDGGILAPCYCAGTFDGPLHGAVHRSDDGGVRWRLVSTLERTDGQVIDEPSLTLLPDGRLMLMTRLDAAIFYSDDTGRTWSFSHHAPFAPLKAHRTATLPDGTVACWMTSHGTLRVSWSRDGGGTWVVGDDGKPLSLDPEAYGYPGGAVLADDSIYVVYYDAANKQQRTTVWAIRFRIDLKTDRLEMLPVAGEGRQRKESSRTPGEIDVDQMK